MSVENMKKLPQNFRPVIDKIAKIPGLGTEKNYAAIKSSYNQINKILEESGCECYDLNNVIQNYRVNNEILPIVMKIKRLMKHRNKELYQQAVKSEHWTTCLKKLKKLAISETGRYVHTKEVRDSLDKTLEPYANHWNGYWTVFNSNEVGDIVGVELFDHGDLERFLSLLKKS